MVVTKSEYLARVQSELSRYRYFEKEPTPQLLAEVQRKCSTLSIPIPRDDKGGILPYPTTKSKKEIFNREKYSEVDNHALKAPTELHAAELSELVSYLLKPAKTDVAKVRVIFRWISGQDLLRYKHIHAPPKESAAMYLNDLKQNKGSYESLFRQMCKYAGIPCEKITGYAKGVSYNVGEDIGDTARNTWNAVLVDKSWRLIDMQWASRQVVTQDKGEWELIDDGTGSKPAKSEDSDVSYDIYAYEEFYFLTDPEEFVYSHFPDEEAWQLLARPMTFEEFQKIAYLRSKFFELSMTVMSHPWCVLQAVNGEANLDMGFISDTMKFSYNLYRSTKVEHKQIQGNVDMDKFLFLETIPDDKTLSVEIFFPTTGKFKAEIFGRDTNETDTVLKWLCTYVFYCETPKTNCRPLPQNPRKEWGPGSDTISMGMEAITHKRGKINVDDGEVEVKFSLNKDRDFLHKLTTEDNKTLDNYTVHRIENGEVIFHARVPGKGQYMLSIMAKEDDEEGGYPSVCNYLLRCDEEFPPLEPFPEIPNGELGPTDEFKKLGLALVENCSAMVTVDKTGQLYFKMKIPKNVEFFAKLGLLIDGNVEDKSEYVSWYREGEIVTFELRFGQKGSYRFNLFAKPAGQPGGFPRAFSSIIEVPIPMMVAMSFPERYAGWTDECKLIEPFNKNLPSKDKVDFAAVVPNAKAVAVVGNEWTQLKKDKDGVWKNSVATIEEGKPMFLSAKFDEAGNSFSHLLKYDVISKEKMDEIARDQKKAHSDADAEYHERTKMKETLKKKAEEKRKQEALEKRRRMELQIMEDGEKKQIEERLDFEEAGKTLSSSDSTARRLEEERKKREEDRKKKDEKIRKREADIIQKRDSRSPATPEDSYFGRPSSTRGSKSADALRDQLKLAIKQKNKVNLERAIAECEAAKLPEIEADLYQAKSFLNSLDSGRPASASPETLRDQLKRAIIQKDKPNLEKAIEEYEASGIRSADDDLQKAKCLLETLGGGRGGPSLPTPDALREELKKATRQKDKRALENIIDVCETTGYPELGPDLCRARNALQQIGGGRGGSLSPDIMKRKLKDAMTEKDKRNLDRIINECTAAGLPELEMDLQKARRLSNILGGGTGDIKSPNELHDQLSMAVRKKDIDTLNKAIMECEAAGYPELDADIRKARVALKNLGGGSRGGSKSPEALRRMLSDAVQHGDKDQLESAVNECVAAGLQELDTDVQQAREVLHHLREKHRPGSRSPVSLRNELKEATKERNRPLLEKLIRECEEAKYPELSSDLKQARDTLKSLSGESGGTISEDTLRDKLEDAVKTKDKSELDRVIRESVAAGMPGLDADIQKARRVSDILGGGSGDVVPSDTLQSQLARAIRQKDIGELKKAIADCEKAGYPELAADVCKARDTLEALGGGRGGSKTPDSLRTNLRNAMREGDKGKLDRVINECVAAGMPELDSDIERARNALEDMKQSSTGSRSPETLRNQLRKATKQRDKSALDRLIGECENAGYPELGSDLLKARSTLENLGGGRGGTLTPESLREKLREAAATMDQDELDNVIMECIAAGLPELDADIEKARQISQDLEMQRHRDIQSPDSLRKQLALAMKQKDAGRLEKLIDECEETGYPELGSDLRKARITLESLGGGRGGIMSPDYLRDKLKSAMETKDKEALDRAIRTSIAAGMPDLEADIQEARRMSDILAGGDGERECPFYLRDNLAKAIRSKDPQALNDAIKSCEEAGYPELGSDVRKARDVLESLGGGRGGTKSPLQLEENLITAMNAGDKEKLERAINESIAAGMPELDNTITEARNILGALKESQERVPKSAENLREELKKALREKDKPELERLIIECEAAQLAELGLDLRKARRTLQILGGGHGGSMCPDTLRKKLNDAMKLKDKITLNKAIRECVIAGFPEMDADIQQARDVADKLGGGTGDKKSPIFLRNQLLRDMRKKDPENLKKSIQECEDAGYPELASDLRKARDALESLGGGRGGILSPFALREELQKAVMEGTIDDIEEILDKCIAAGMPELDSDIEHARSKLDERRKYEASPDALRRELQKAVEAGNMAALEKAISQCEDAGHPELSSDLRNARDILESLSDGRGGSITPDSLRNQLKRATTQKNKASLERAIHDAEAAGYPEVAYDLQKARETLEKLGGGRGGIKTPESLREELKHAMKEADEPALARAIKDATAAGFPELASDVQKARDKLDQMRGGRGATKSAESLKKMLHDAVAMKNKSALEQAIKECEAAAYPELSYDLREARDALENIGGGRGGSKSPDILRNKLKSAIRQKDPIAIEKAINECVAAGQPELTGDIQQARDTLNSIGGAHKAPKSPSLLRDQLDHAAKLKDIVGLERAIAEAEAAKSPELSNKIKQARDLLDSLDGGGRSRSLSPEQVGTFLDQINASIIHKDKPKLEKAIAAAEPYRHPELEPQIQKARPLLDALDIKEKLESAFLTDNQEDIRRCVIEIEQKNLTDYLSIEVNEARSRIRGYAAPDPSAFLNRDDVSIDSRTSSRMGWYMRSAGFSHDLLISALVVLGEYERHSESQAWRNYQHFFDISNSDGSSRRVLGFDIDQIYQNLSARADEILTRNTTDEVQLMNRSGQMSYSWSRSLNEQMRAYFHNLNGTTGGGESSFGETHSMSQMSGTSRTEYQAFTASRESSQGSDNTNAHRPATERHSTTSSVRSVNRSGPATFFSQRKY